MTEKISLEIIQEAIRSLKDKPKTVIIFFTNLYGHYGFMGDFVDKVLNCSEDEKGFLIDISMRKYFENYKNGYIERLPNWSILIDNPKGG